MDIDSVFPDLTPYSREIGPHTLKGVFNVGWLNINSEFPTGEVPDGFVDRLKEIAGSFGPFRPLVEQIRELPRCDVCGAIEMNDARGGVIRNAELWIPGNGVLYASPLAMIHFIELHGYCPPEDYIDAVSKVDQDLEFDADQIYRQKLKESDWFANRADKR
jgi:hypothetical protein